MKKKLVAIIMCITMSACLLAGCGSDTEEAPAADATQTEETETEEAESTEEAETTEDADNSSETCSDETFSDIQDAYAYLTEEYNMIVDFYKNNSDIPQDDDVESALSTAKEYLDQMGEINQADITEADAEEIGQSMTEVADALAQMAEALGAVSDAAAASDSSCSDETFSSLQDAYSYLTEEYNTIVDYYQNNDSVPQDDDVESALASAKEYLDQMGSVQQNTITESDAADLAQSMIDVATALETLANALVQ